MEQPRARTPSAAALLALEARRLLGKKSYIVLVALGVAAPLLVSLLIRGPVHKLLQQAHLPHQVLSTAWLAFLGSSRALGGLLNAGAFSALGLAAVSLTSYSWIIAVVFAALIVAGDIVEGRLQLLVVRPVTRRRLLAVKIAALTVSLALLFTVSAAAVYVSATILFGSQAKPWLMPVYGAVLAAALIPLEAATMIIALKLRRSGVTMLLGILLYIVGSMISALPMVQFIRSLGAGAGGEAAKQALRAMMYLNVAEPLHGGPNLAKTLLDAVIAGLHAQATMPGFNINLGVNYAMLLAVGAASLAAASLVLYAVASLVFSRQTL